jgi:hypothetical protein
MTRPVLEGDQRQRQERGERVTAAEFELLKEVEAELVIRWRFHELSEAGYEPTDALRLATQTDVDLHLATDLLRRGCPRQTALRILL